VRDSAGNALAADYQVSFTTGAPAKPIVGYNQIGLTTDFGDGNWLNGSRVLNGSTSTSLTSMSVFVRSINSAPENKFQLAIYTDANGSPGTLVASTGRSYGSVHSMLRESGTMMRSRGGPNHRTRVRQPT